jgi:dTDP-4-amino-4,6-dideoxygalactose transaminase
MDVKGESQIGIPAILGGPPLFPEGLPMVRPALPRLSDVASDVEEMLQNGIVTNADHVADFEARTAAFLGVEPESVVAVSSCTSGLMLVLKAMELAGEVVVPSFTFSATVHALIWNGLLPAFADCDPETLNVDPDSVERLLSPRVTAILGVHIFGSPCEVELLSGIARSRGLRLVFDAAHGFGASFRGQKIGSFGDAEVFSLTPTKTVVAGEGGLVVARDAEIARRVRIGRNYGDPGTYDCEFSGLNARMPEFNAILGKQTLGTLAQTLESREAWAGLYRERLSGIPGLTFQQIAPYCRTTYKDFTLLVEASEFGLSRDDLAQALECEGIMTKKYFFPPQHRQRAFAGLSARADGDLPHTEHVSRRTLSLPLFPGLGRANVDGVCRAIERIHSHASRITGLR